MNLYAKAKQQFYNSAGVRIKRGHKKTYIEIEDLESHKTHEVTIEQTPEGKILDCPCLHQTYKVTRPVVCSHMITALMEIVRRQKVKQ